MSALHGKGQHGEIVMTSGEQSASKGILAAVIAAIAAILVALFANFQNIFGGAETPRSTPSVNATPPTDIRADHDAIVITGSSAGRDIGVNTKSDPKR